MSNKRKSERIDCVPFDLNHAKDVIRRVRVENGYTLEALAKLMFVTPQAIAKWESKNNKSFMSMNSFVIFLRVTKASAYEILGISLYPEKLPADHLDERTPDHRDDGKVVYLYHDDQDEIA